MNFSNPLPAVRENHPQKFLLSLAVVIFSFLLWLRLGSALGWQPDVMLATLIALAFFLNLWALLFFVALSAFLLNWQPMPGLELILFAALLFFIFFFLNIIFPLEGWLSTIVYIMLSVGVLYFVPHVALALENYVTVLQDAGASAVMGLIVFSVFSYCYQENI